MYSSGFLDELKQRISLSDVIARDIALTKRGKEFDGLCPFHNETRPSFNVIDDRGFYFCQTCRQTGDHFNYMMTRYGLTFGQAVKQLAVEVGMESAGGDIIPLHARPPVDLVDKEERERQAAALRAEKIIWARSVWNDAVPAAGTMVEHYLANRRINFAKIGGIPPTIKYHPRLKHIESGQVLPAMVSGVLVHDESAPGGRRLTGIHRTFLSKGLIEEEPLVAKALETFPGSKIINVKKSVKKANVDPNKKMGGVFVGGAIRLAKAGPILGITEGIETGLSVMQATGFPVWVAGSLGLMGQVVIPNEVQKVYICADNDSAEKDRKAHDKILNNAVEFLRSQNLEVVLVRSETGTDFNDMMRV